MSSNQNVNVTQAVVTEAANLRPGQSPLRLALFDDDGNPLNIQSILDDLTSRVEELESASE